MDYYGTIAGAIAYHEARGRSLAAYDDDDILSAALLVGSEFVDYRYRASFPGLRLGQRAQLREWPRQGAQDVDGYAIDPTTPPIEVEYATYEAMYRELKLPGSLAVDWIPNKYRRASVDGAVSVEYVVYGSASDVQGQFMIIDQILSKILTGVGANFSALSGATSRV